MMGDEVFTLPIAIGERIGPYRLTSEIGEGGFGIVYRATQEEPVHREVAIKVIRPGMDTRGVIARFEAERQALAMMDHQNIAKVLDAGATNAGRPYFVMELVVGERITDFCDNHRLSTRRRLEIFTQVCSAVQHAHQKGIIHRDIKPSNVLVAQTERGPVPKVIDFGIAKAIGEQPLTDKTLVTSCGQFLGTPVYTSPEQAGVGRTDVDTRTDIYSLGVLLYELLTGETPHRVTEIGQTTAATLLEMIREHEPMRPSARLKTLDAEQLVTVAARRHSVPESLPSEVAGDLDWIVMKALEKNRDRRYETPHRLLDDIQRYLCCEPVSARPPSKSYQIRKFLRRHRTESIAGALSLLSLLCAFAVSTSLYLSEREARQKSVDAENAQKRLRTLAETNEFHAKLKARESEQIADFLTKIFASVNPDVAMGLDTTLIRKIISNAGERMAVELANQPEVEASLRATIGHLLMNFDELAQSESNYRLALKLEQEIHGSDSRESALVRLELSHILWLEGYLPEAEEQSRLALKILRKWGNEDSPDVLSALEGVGVIIAVAGRNEEAEPIFRQILSTKRKLFGPLSEPVARTLSNLGEVLNAEGNHIEAETLYREALAIYSARTENQHFFDTAYALQHLSEALIPLGKHDEAEKVLVQSLEIRRRYLPKGHTAIISSLEAYGMELNREGKFEASLPILEEALALYRDRYPKEPSRWKSAVKTLADSLLQLGWLDRREQLIQQFEKEAAP